MTRQYTGGQSVVLAQIMEEEVTVQTNDLSGVYVKFDKTPTQVRKHTSINFEESVVMVMLSFLS